MSEAITEEEMPSPASVHAHALNVRVQQVNEKKAKNMPRGGRDADTCVFPRVRVTNLPHMSPLWKSQFYLLKAKGGRRRDRDGEIPSSLIQLRVSQSVALLPLTPRESAVNKAKFPVAFLSPSPQSSDGEDGRRTGRERRFKKHPFVPLSTTNRERTHEMPGVEGKATNITCVAGSGV